MRQLSYRPKPSPRLWGILIMLVSLGLVLGGALGNLWDRVVSGRVIDFLDFYFGPHHWPAFNIADSAIVIGALLLLSEIFLAPQEEKVISQQ